MIMKKTILIVDDEALNREMLSDILGDDYAIVEADDGDVALKLIEDNLENLAAVLLDLTMKRVGGREVLSVMRDKGWSKIVPVLIISAEDKKEVQIECLENGAVDYIGKPFDETMVKLRVRNSADLYELKNNLQKTVDSQTEELVEKNKRLHRINTDIIELLGNIVEARNQESGEHVIRVKGYTRILAYEVMRKCPEFGLTPANVEAIAASSPLHDIGKIMISDAILLKPGRLTPEEFEIMKTHTIKGCEVLGNIGEVWTEQYGRYCYDICRYHHEKWDGKGYPDGLKGDEIPIAAQIVSVADVFDALTSERVYKKAYSKDEAYRMILNGECGQFSPKVLDCFVSCRSEIEALTF